MADAEVNDEESALSGSVETVNEAMMVLADCVAVLSGEDKVRSAASITMDEIRNRAVYELNREKLDTSVDLSEDDTLPYLEATGSQLDRVIALADNVVGAVALIVDSADTWSVVTDPESE